MIENADFTPPADPYALFTAWFQLAERHEPDNHNAMTVATLDEDGYPAARVLLLKDYDPNGFTFYTNRHSAKGRELQQHPKASLCFHWKSLRRQVRIDGAVEPVSDAESDAYFATRPRGSQIGAWASLQSEPLASREALEARVREVEQRYEGKDVPRPAHWGGYHLTPHRIEFWQERPFRLHDRIVYRRDKAAGAWSIGRLYP